jgi:hypothetical protein
MEGGLSRYLLAEKYLRNSDSSESRTYFSLSYILYTNNVELQKVTYENSATSDFGVYFSLPCICMFTELNTSSKVCGIPGHGSQKNSS